METVPLPTAPPTSGSSQTTVTITRSAASGSESQLRLRLLVSLFFTYTFYNRIVKVNYSLLNVKFPFLLTIQIVFITLTITLIVRLLVA